MTAPAPAASLTFRNERGICRGMFTAMANPCEILCETQDEELAREISAAAHTEASRIERKFSRYRDDSVIHALNTAQGKTLVVDRETAQLLDYADALWRLSAGAFDITSGVFRHAWRFGESASKPTAEQVASMLARVGWQRVTWSRPTLTMPAEMELDFGGIGKEYAVDRVVTLIGELANIPVLVNFGGDLRTAGPPPANGAWQVGIESVVKQGEASNLIKLTTGAMATSGDTHRFVEIDGIRYGHIIDARTGWPAPNAPRSVTVAADTCTQAGTYSTLAMLEGVNAEVFLMAQGVRYWCLR